MTTFNHCENKTDKTMNTMTTDEIRKIIAEAAKSECFAAVKATFNYNYIDQTLTLSGVSAIFEYVNQQLSGWEKYDQLPDVLNNSKEYFTKIKDAIIKFVDTCKTNINAGNLNSHWQNNVNNLISNVTRKPLPYDIPQVEFLLKVSRETPAYLQGAYNFIVDANANIPANLPIKRDILYGVILAYEFTLKNHTGITTRRSAEESSISKLRTDFQKYLSESEKQLLQYLQDTHAKCKEHAKQIDVIKTDKENLFVNWFEETKNEIWGKWYEVAVQKVTDLENTYKEKLKLEEPAKYWDDRAKKLKKQGWCFFAIVALFVITICVFLGIILTKTPDIIYASWFGADKSVAIKWTMIYITLISFIAYCIRALSKIMFSSFHLARDCEERHTLTYFYLSLLKDSKVDDKDRQLIMQSLFSRAETGLLKDDSSPTMPNEIISKIVSSK